MPIRIVPVRSDAEADPGVNFDLWRLPGPKCLRPGPGHTLVLSSGGHQPLVLGIDDALLAEDRFALLVPSATRPEVAAKTFRSVHAAITGAAPPSAAGVLPVGRTAIAHARALQALDGLAAGASHRTIASILFGIADVQRRWTADGELRAQVRYLIRRARTLRDGGYRQLLESD